MENWTIDIGRWAAMPLMEQMANIGSEVGRAGDLFSDSFLQRDDDALAYLEKYFGQFASAIRRKGLIPRHQD